MSVKMGIWRIDGNTPRRLGSSVLPSETTLEDFLEHDPSLLGERLLVIGRQVPTAYGKLIDLLAMDGDGNLHVLELKRDKTPRDVVAQILDYGSWVSMLDREKVIGIANNHLDVVFESAFEDVFGGSAPDELNAELRLTIIATELDTSSERIVTYLRGFGVPVNAVFFSFLEDEDRRYLARSWLAQNEEIAGTDASSVATKLSGPTGTVGIGSSPSANTSRAGPGTTDANTASSLPVEIRGIPALCELCQLAPESMFTFPSMATSQLARPWRKPSHLTSHRSCSAATGRRSQTSFWWAAIATSHPGSR